jgi:peptide/nickel transport system substrate-binding protein
VSTRPKTIFFEDEEQSECSMFLVGWSNSNGDASGTFEYLLHTNDPEKQLGGANSSTQYSNPVLDAHIQEAARTVDRGAREEIMHQCMHIAMHDLPHVPLHYQIDLYGVVDRLQWDARQDRRLRAFEMHWSEGQP